MYLIILFFLILFSILFDENKPSKGLLAFTCFFFIIIIGFRSPNIDNDYQNYVWVASQGYGFAEKSFSLIANISYVLTNDTLLIFVIYATISTICLFIGIYKYSLNFWHSLMFWFCTYFILYSMNAIRAGAAIGIAILAWDSWAKREHFKVVLLLLLATLFHYAFALLLVSYPFIRNNEKNIYLFLTLIPVAYAIHFLMNVLDVVSLFNITIVNIKTNAYNKTITGELPVFSTILLVKIVLIAIMFIYRERLAEIHDKFYLLYKLYIVGFFCSVSLSSLPTIAVRTTDVFAFSEIVLIPLFCQIVNPKWVATSAIALYSIFYYYMYVIQATYIRPYESIIF